MYKKLKKKKIGFYQEKMMAQGSLTYERVDSSVYGRLGLLHFTFKFLLRERKSLLKKQNNFMLYDLIIA